MLFRSIKKEGNGLYFFNLKGEVTVNRQELSDRDALEITNFKTLEIKSNTDAEFLLLEIPMKQ